jgi:uncharacterized protein
MDFVRATMDLERAELLRPATVTRPRRARVGVVGVVALALTGLFAAVLLESPAAAQVKPSTAEVRAYRGLHAAAAAGDTARIRRLLAAKADPNARDERGRTPAHVAAHFRRRSALRLLLRGGTDANALDDDRYDVVTIAGVANDPETIRVALANGARATNITSIYDGTALIAAAHLGHVEVVRTLVQAGAPLDHVNNLGWTALIEAVILGDGGRRHTEVVRILVNANADTTIADRGGQTRLLRDGPDPRGRRPAMNLAPGVPTLSPWTSLRTHPMPSGTHRVPPRPGSTSWSSRPLRPITAWERVDSMPRCAFASMSTTTTKLRCATD